MLNFDILSNLNHPILHRTVNDDVLNEQIIIILQSTLYIYIQLVMLLRRVTQPLQQLLNKNIQRFGQATVSHNEDEPTKQTKHNPHAIKDLRGYEHLEEIKET